MKILLLDYKSSIFASVESWDAANIAAKAVLKRKYWSNLYYDIHFDDGTSTAGSIDLEPESFHKPHQNEIFTWHLRTFWTNISKAEPSPNWTQKNIDFASKLLTYLPKS